MNPESAVQFLHFGSRAGTLAGLAFFCVLLAILGWAIARLAGRGRAAAGVGFAMFISLLVLVYVSMFGGFYEAELRRGEVALHFLIDPRVKTLPLDSIRFVRPYFAYKLRWRLDIGTDSGQLYTSASGSREAVTSAAERLQDAIRLSGPTE